MVWDIFVICFGLVLVFLIGCRVFKCMEGKRTAVESNKTAWSYAFWGWLLVLIGIVVDIMIRIALFIIKLEIQEL